MGPGRITVEFSTPVQVASVLAPVRPATGATAILGGVFDLSAGSWHGCRRMGTWGDVCEFSQICWDGDAWLYVDSGGDEKPAYLLPGEDLVSGRVVPPRAVLPRAGGVDVVRPSLIRSWRASIGRSATRRGILTRFTVRSTVFHRAVGVCGPGLLPTRHRRDVASIRGACRWDAPVLQSGPVLLHGS